MATKKTLKQFIDHYEKVLKTIKELDALRDNEKLNILDWIHQSRQELGRFINIYDNTHFVKKKEFKEAYLRWWKLGRM